MAKKQDTTLEYSFPIYGIWVGEKEKNYYPDGGGWWRDGDSLVFNTPDRRVAQAQLQTIRIDMSASFYILEIREIK